jgi:hypothetical protein
VCEQEYEYDKHKKVEASLQFFAGGMCGYLNEVIMIQSFLAREGCYCHVSEISDKGWVNLLTSNNNMPQDLWMKKIKECSEIIARVFNQNIYIYFLKAS